MVVDRSPVKEMGVNTRSTRRDGLVGSDSNYGVVSSNNIIIFTEQQQEPANCSSCTSNFNQYAENFKSEVLPKFAGSENTACTYSTYNSDNSHTMSVSCHFNPNTINLSSTCGDYIVGAGPNIYNGQSKKTSTFLESNNTVQPMLYMNEKPHGMSWVNSHSSNANVLESDSGVRVYTVNKTPIVIARPLKGSVPYDSSHNMFSNTDKFDLKHIGGNVNLSFEESLPNLYNSSVSGTIQSSIGVGTNVDTDYVVTRDIYRENIYPKNVRAENVLGNYTSKGKLSLSAVTPLSDNVNIGFMPKDISAGPTGTKPDERVKYGSEAYYLRSNNNFPSRNHEYSSSISASQVIRNRGRGTEMDYGEALYLNRNQQEGQIALLRAAHRNNSMLHERVHEDLTTGLCGDNMRKAVCNSNGMLHENSMRMASETLPKPHNYSSVPAYLSNAERLSCMDSPETLNCSRKNHLHASRINMHDGINSLQLERNRHRVACKCQENENASMQMRRRMYSLENLHYSEENKASRLPGSMNLHDCKIEAGISRVCTSAVESSVEPRRYNESVRVYSNTERQHLNALAELELRGSSLADMDTCLHERETEAGLQQLYSSATRTHVAAPNNFNCMDASGSTARRRLGRDRSLERQTGCWHVNEDPHRRYSRAENSTTPAENVSTYSVTNPVEALTASLNANLAANKLPTPEPVVFEGDPTEFTGWEISFNKYVVEKVSLPSELLFFLGKYTKGKAQTAKAMYLPVATMTAYDLARKVLRDRFGNPYIIATAFREKINMWPNIAANNPEGLQEFSDFLFQCLGAVFSINYLNILNDPEENRKMLQKLPTYMVNKWAKIMDEWTYIKGEFPPFSAFCEFVATEARIACNPIIKDLKRQQLLQPLSKAQNTQKENLKSARVFAVAEAAEATCPICGEGADHASVVNCKKFLDADLNKRHAFVNNFKLCRGCLRPYCRYLRCKKKMRCSKCQKWHPELLHNPMYDKKEETEVTSHCITDAKTTMQCMIVPVIISDPYGNSARVYGLLDPQSTTSFLTERTLQKLRSPSVDTTLKLSTVMGEHLVSCKRVTGLKITSGTVANGEIVKLPQMYTREEIPADRSSIPNPEIARNYQHLRNLEIPDVEDMDIGCLLGLNVSSLLRPLDVVLGEKDQPYAVRTVLGWGIIGNIGEQEGRAELCFRTAAKEIIETEKLLNIFSRDFQTESLSGATMSINEKKFIKFISDELKVVNGHFQLPLPIKRNAYFPESEHIAVKRLQSLKARFIKDPQFYERYKAYFDDLIQKGYIKELNPSSSIKEGWYIPHFGVFNPKKPEKLRVVMDGASCGAGGVSINKNIMNPPDLLNNMCGILLRPRQERILLACDIEGMFFKVKLDDKSQKYVKTLWFKNGLNSAPVTFVNTYHVFGLASSPAVACFALRQAADRGEKKYGTQAAEFIRRDTYMDDSLGSFETTEEAKSVLKGAVGICAEFGFKLHKFISNSAEVLDNVPESYCKILPWGETSLEETGVRVLGIEYDVKSDHLQFRVNFEDRVITKRYILSCIARLHDLLGLVSPCLLVGKRIFQAVVAGGGDWDDRVDAGLREEFIAWRSDLKSLAELKIPRCFKPYNFGKVSCISLHHFADATSSAGYGQVTYIKFVNYVGRVHVALCTSKARVLPAKNTFTVARSELVAAVLNVRMSVFLRKHLGISVTQEYFYTDSKIVMGYISNENRRFSTFVANRIQYIRENSNPEQWFWLPGDKNVSADICSRGLRASELIQCKQWWKGPDFLWGVNSDVDFLETSKNISLEENDPEVKKVTAFAVTVKTDDEDILKRFYKISNWYHLKRAVANILKLKNKWLKRKVETGLNVATLEEAEREIIMRVQRKAFKIEIDLLSKKEDLPRNNKIIRLNPVLQEGVLLVGGRIKHATFDTRLVHPVILPKESPITVLILRHFHEKVHHQGRGITLNAVRTAGFWVIGASSLVARMIQNCVACCRTRGTKLHQKMADLPADRIDCSMWSYCAVDFFGPFMYKAFRKEIRCYGVLFTCLASRAVHLEVAPSLETDSFINCYRRFICRRGPVRQLRCDRETNFVGMKNEMDATLRAFKGALLRENCDWVDFKFNYPHASHMGGVWERQIRSVRNVLSVVITQHAAQLSYDAIVTFFCEAENIINGRPLTVESLNDPTSPLPLSPNQILTQKSNVVLPPPGVFEKPELFSRKMYKRTQYVVNEFFYRFKREYIKNLQERQCWTKTKRNLQVGDIVLMVDEMAPRNVWPLCRVIETVIDLDGLVCKVKIEIGDKNRDCNGKRIQLPKTLERPISQLILVFPENNISEEKDLN